MTGTLKLIITPEEVGRAVRRLAGEISRDYAGRNPVLIGVLKAAFVFMSDLAREMKIDFEVDFIQASCYGDRTCPKERVGILGDTSTDIRGRDVIIVEGIVDRGVTAEAIAGHLRAKGPSSIKLCALLLRDSSPGARADYAGLKVGKGFVVGYGLDYNGRYRGLPGIYVLEGL